jgi:fido (protein-threonine AMPylation protein)
VTPLEVNGPTTTESHRDQLSSDTALRELRTAVLGGHWAQVGSLCSSIRAEDSREQQLLDQLACQATLNARAARALSIASRSSQFADAADAGCHLVRAVRRNLAAVDGDHAQALTLLREDLPASGSLRPEWARLPLSDVGDLSRSLQNHGPLRVIGLARPSAGDGLTVGDAGSSVALTITGISERVARGTPVELVGRDAGAGVLECQFFGILKQVPDYAKACAAVEDLYAQAGVAHEPMQVRVLPSSELDQSVLNARAKRRIAERNAELAAAECFEAASRTSQLSLETLARVHEIIIGASAPGAGKLRQTVAVIRWCGVITYRAPPVATARSQASACLRNVATELERGNCAKHPAALAAEAMALLNKSHPFADGNGRVARALATWLMLRSGFERRTDGTLGTFLDAYLDEYYRTLGSFDASPWGWHQLFYDAALATFRRAHANSGLTPRAIEGVCTPPVSATSAAGEASSESANLTLVTSLR